MRKILITLAILLVFIVALLASWIFAGRQISLLLDRWVTIEMISTRISSIAYEGSGTGGILRINDLGLSLNDRNDPAPSIGTTKDDQLALANGGKVFAFGPAQTQTGSLATAPQAGDTALLITRHSALSWPTPFDFNFMTGHSPSWKRHIYYELRWTKPAGASLDMLWRYEQLFYGKQLIPGNGWDNGFGVHPPSTGLIRIQIRP